MALKVKAQEKLQKNGTYAGKYRYIVHRRLKPAHPKNA